MTHVAVESEDIQRRIATVLVIRQPNGGIRTPVITLASEKTCIYGIIEKHVRPEGLLGTDRWWRVCKSLYQPPLEVGIYCEALSNKSRSIGPIL